MNLGSQSLYSANIQTIVIIFKWKYQCLCSIVRCKGESVGEDPNLFCTIRKYMNVSLFIRNCGHVKR